MTHLEFNSKELFGLHVQLNTKGLGYEIWVFSPYKARDLKEYENACWIVGTNDLFSRISYYIWIPRTRNIFKKLFGIRIQAPVTRHLIKRVWFALTNRCAYCHMRMWGGIFSEIQSAIDHKYRHDLNCHLRWVDCEPYKDIDGYERTYRHETHEEALAKNPHVFDRKYTLRKAIESEYSRLDYWKREWSDYSKARQLGCNHRCDIEICHCKYIEKTERSSEMWKDHKGRYDYHCKKHQKRLVWLRHLGGGLYHEFECSDYTRKEENIQ